MDCIFCKIVAGEIPAQKVHESDRFLAILDINPLAPGHTLLMPRAHHEILTDLPSDLAQELAVRTQEVARAVVKAVKAEGFNVLVNNHKCSGQAIPHVHAHVIPRRPTDGVKFNWDPRPYRAGEIEKMAEQIREALK